MNLSIHVSIDQLVNMLTFYVDTSSGHLCKAIEWPGGKWSALRIGIVLPEESLQFQFSRGDFLALHQRSSDEFHRIVYIINVTGRVLNSLMHMDRIYTFCFVVIAS